MAIKRAIYDVAEFKALPSDDNSRGRFEAIVSVFGNEDTQGDRVMEGAFQKSLEQWQASGHPIPIIWSHQWGNPEAHIGAARPENVTEIPGRGLKVVGDIDIDDAFGAKVYKLMDQRRVKEFSFGYGVRKQRRGKDGVNELVELDLIEAGPTLKGANPSTELLAIKAELNEAAQEEDTPGIVVTDGAGTLIGNTFSAKAGARFSRVTKTAMLTYAASMREMADALEDLVSEGETDEEETEEVEADDTIGAKATDDQQRLLELNALIYGVEN